MLGGRNIFYQGFDGCWGMVLMYVTDRGVDPFFWLGGGGGGGRKSKFRRAIKLNGFVVPDSAFFIPILALHIMNFSSCWNYFAPPPNIFMGGGGGTAPPPPPGSTPLVTEVNNNSTGQWTWYTLFDTNMTILQQQRELDSSLITVLLDTRYKSLLTFVWFFADV